MPHMDAPYVREMSWLECFALAVGTAAVVVGVFLLALLLSVKPGEDARVVACEAAGGVMFRAYASRDLCLRRDAVIDLDKKP